MAQLKDKNGNNVMPNTTAENVSYGNSTVAAALAGGGGGGGSSYPPLAGKKLCFFGDSISDPFANTGGYPELTIAKVGAITADASDKFANSSAIYGVSGGTSATVKGMVLGKTIFDADWMRTRFAQHIAAGYEDAKDFTKFEAVIIMIGTNPSQGGDIDADIPDICVTDIESYPYSYSAPGKTKSSADLANADEFFSKCFGNTYYGDLAASVEYIRWKNANCRIFLVTIPPNTQYKTAQESNFDNVYYKKVRERIIALADKMSVQVIDAQVRAGLGEWDITHWSGDGIHPNAIGKELWASYVAHELEKQFYETNLT